MKLPIAGLIVIFCLQGLFIALTAFDRFEAALWYESAVKVDGQENLEAAEVPETEYPVVVSSSPRGRFALLRPTTRPPAIERNLNGTSKAVLAVGNRPLRTQPLNINAQKREYIPVLMHPRVILTGFEKNEFTPIKNQENRKEKRSFIVKSVNIIKKPYDWLKAIGSRLK